MYFKENLDLQLSLIFKTKILISCPYRYIISTSGIPYLMHNAYGVFKKCYIQIIASNVKTTCRLRENMGGSCQIH